MGIHPTAVVHPGVELESDDVDIGPFAVVDDGVRLHSGVVVGPHAVITGPTVVGRRTRVGAHAVLGGEPQDLKHDGGPTRLEVGEDNVFREFSTAHRGSSAGRGVTIVGDRNYFMCNSHVAHDCTVGNDCMFANSVAIAGFVEIGDRVVLGGLAGVHQHTRVGRVAMIAAGAICTQDVPPFTLAQGDRARLFGLNIIGMRRAGMDADAIAALQGAWRLLFTQGKPMRTVLSQAREEFGAFPDVQELLEFLHASQRGVAQSAAAEGRTP